MNGMCPMALGGHLRSYVEVYSPDVIRRNLDAISHCPDLPKACLQKTVGYVRAALLWP